MLNKLGHKLATFLKERVDYGASSKSQSDQFREFDDVHRLHEFMPYDRYDTQTGLFHNLNGVGFVLETFPLVGCSEEMQREVSGIFQNILPEDSYFQCLLWADCKIKPILNRWAHPRQSHSDMMAFLAEQRCDHLEELGIHEQSGTLLKNYRCILSFSLKGSVTSSVEKERLQFLRNQIITTFEGLGLPIWQWNADDLLRFLDEVVNFQPTIAPSTLSWNPFDNLSKQLPTMGTHLEIKDDGLILNKQETIIKSYAVKSAPEAWSLHAMNELIGDNFRDFLRMPCPFMIHYGVYIPKQSSVQEMFLAKASYVERQAQFGTLRNMLPRLGAEADEIAYVRKQLDTGVRMVSSNLTVTLFSPASELAKSEQILLSVYRSKEWDLVSDRYCQLVSYLTTFPMIWGEGIVEGLKFLHRLKTTVSTESANVLPIQGEWKGTPSPGMLLAGRRGQLFTWSPFDNTAGNYNTCVVGRSGSGKSVFMQELMTSMLGMGGQVFVLDVGRSFEKTCGLLGGQFVEFTSRSNLSLNPFTNLKGLDEEALNDAWAMIRPVLALMAAPTRGTDDIENALLEKAMQAAWSKKQGKATITDIAEYLKSLTNDRRAEDLGTMLFPFTKDGIYGRFFEGEANVNFKNKLVVIELEELKERKDLQSVIVQMVIIQITKQMFLGDRQTPTLIIFDEAWDLLRGKQSGVFVETLARRVRKYRGSLVVGTQTINDFFQSPAAQASFDNSDWMCLLSQKKESIELLRENKRIVMDGQMESLLSSVKTKQGEYAEVMIYGSHGYAIGRLILDPFSQILYSTKAEEYAAVKHLQEQGLSILDAVKQVSGIGGIKE